MITIDNVQYRNLEEQVKKNMDDIKYILEEEGVLNEFGIKVVGQVSTSGQLPDPDTYEGEFGDAYAVGTTTPYTFYIYTRANGGVGEPYWFNIGQFPVPSTIPGPTGPQGAPGTDGRRGSLWLQGTSDKPVISGNIANDKYINSSNGNIFNFNGSTWVQIGNIRGPQGIQGIQGQTGQMGPMGPQGQKGDKGDPGVPFYVAGIVANEGQLPEPTEANRSQAYLVGSNNNYDMYVIVGTTNLEWVNAGKVEGVVGPQGPQGNSVTDVEPVYQSTDEYGNYLYKITTYLSDGSQVTSTSTFTAPRGPQGLQGIAGQTGRGIQSIISGSPIISGNQTQTPVTVSYSDNTTSNFTVYAERGEQGPQGIQGVPGVAGSQGPQGPTGPAGEVDYSLVYTKEEVDNGFIKSSGETSRTGTLPITVENSTIHAIEVTSGNDVGFFDVDGISFLRGGNGLFINRTGTINYLPITAEGMYSIHLPEKTGTLATTDDITSEISNLNLSQYATTEYVDSKVTGVYVYKGSVATYNDLPSSGQTVGDVYNVEDTGDNYAWDGKKWDKLSGTVDLTNYYTKTQVDSALSQKADTSSIPTALSQLTNDTGFITNTVDNLTNYDTTTVIDGKLALKADKTEIPNLDNYALKTDLDDYLPLTGGTISGNLTSDVIISQTPYQIRNDDSLVMQIGTTSISRNPSFGVQFNHFFPNKSGTFAMTSDIPTAVSQLNNDSNFVTEDTSNLANYYTSTVIDQKLADISGGPSYYNTYEQSATFDHSFGGSSGIPSDYSQYIIIAIATLRFVCNGVTTMNTIKYSINGAVISGPTEPYTITIDPESNITATLEWRYQSQPDQWYISFNGGTPSEGVIGIDYLVFPKT